jgi:hypothetical protein
MSYDGVFYSLAPGDYIIVSHSLEYQPDQVNTISSTTFTTISNAPLTAANTNGDWYYDNNTNLFSYIGKNF